MAYVQLAGESFARLLPHYLSLFGRVSYTSDYSNSLANLGSSTILITVLTNSFMTIASNANEEHQ